MFLRFSRVNISALVFATSRGLPLMALLGGVFSGVLNTASMMFSKVSGPDMGRGGLTAFLGLRSSRLAMPCSSQD